MTCYLLDWKKNTIQTEFTLPSEFGPISHYYVRRFLYERLEIGWVGYAMNYVKRYEELFSAAQSCLESTICSEFEQTGVAEHAPIQIAWWGTYLRKEAFFEKSSKEQKSYAPEFMTWTLRNPLYINFNTSSEETIILPTLLSMLTLILKYDPEQSTFNLFYLNFTAYPHNMRCI